MTTTAVLHRSIISRAAAASSSRRRLMSQQRSFFPAASAGLLTSSSSSCWKSSSPDYINYETWHAHRLDDHQTFQQRQQQYVHGGHGSHAVMNNNRINHSNSHPVNLVDNNSPLEGPRTSVLMELNDRVGALHDVLKY